MNELQMSGEVLYISARFALGLAADLEFAFAHEFELNRATLVVRYAHLDHHTVFVLVEFDVAW